MALSLTTVRANLLLRIKDLSDVSQDTFLQWSNFISDFLYEHGRSSDPLRFTDTESFTVSSSPQTSALPTDFKDITLQGLGFYYVDSESKDTEIQLTRTGPGRRDKGYYLEGANVVFTGISDGSIYKLRHHIERTAFTAMTDYFTLDATLTGAELLQDGKMQYLVEALSKMYMVWDEDSSGEFLADQRFVRSLNQLLSYYRREPGAYQVNDISSIY